MQTRAAQPEYTVRLENFQGPLDLLLHLIREAEVEITDIPISTIADQYLERLGRLDDIDVENGAEFLVMAATLLELKSRALSPRFESDEDEAESTLLSAVETGALDPRSELVRQLLAYKWCREAADALEERRAEWRRAPAAAHRPELSEDERQELDDLDLDDVGIYDIVEAYARIVEQVDFARLGDHRVEIDDTPIEAHIETLRSIFEQRESNRILFDDLFSERNRSEVIGLFLAILEMIRRGEVALRQDDLQSSIVVERLTGDGAEEPPADVRARTAESAEPVQQHED